MVLHTRGVKTNDFRVDRYGAPPYPEVVLFTKRSTLVLSSWSRLPPSTGSGRRSGSARRSASERDGVGVTVGKQTPALHVSQVFLQPAQRPRAIRPQAENVAADFAGLGPKSVLFGKEVGVEQADEVGEAVVVAVVRRGCEQNDVAGGLRGEMFGQLVSLGLRHFITAPG